MSRELTQTYIHSEVKVDPNQLVFKQLMDFEKILSYTPTQVHLRLKYFISS